MHTHGPYLNALPTGPRAWSAGRIFGSIDGLALFELAFRLWLEGVRIGRRDVRVLVGLLEGAVVFANAKPLRRPVVHLGFLCVVRNARPLALDDQVGGRLFEQHVLRVVDAIFIDFKEHWAALALATCLVFQQLHVSERKHARQLLLDVDEQLGLVDGVRDVGHASAKRLRKEERPVRPVERPLPTLLLFRVFKDNLGVCQEEGQLFRAIVADQPPCLLDGDMCFDFHVSTLLLLGHVSVVGLVLRRGAWGRGGMGASEVGRTQRSTCRAPG